MPDFAAWLGSGVEAIDAPADADALAATLVSRLATPPMEVRAGGALSDAQAPQFLKLDGSRMLVGNLPVAAGYTVDGVDISAHAAVRAAAFQTADQTHSSGSIRGSIAMTLEGYTVETSARYRVNPKTGLTVERQLPSGRWKVVSHHATRASARLRLLQIIGQQKQRA